ncbi:MAG: IclR family transcriptional regulator [Ilumatobacter sp.]
MNTPPNRPKKRAGTAPSRSAPSGTLLTLERGIRVLEEIAKGNGLGTARSIGTSLGINQGTVYQILRTLLNSGYVHRLAGGRYQLGARIAYLVDGYQSQAAPPQVIIDHLHALHMATDETVYAALALGSTIAIVASHESTKRLRVGSFEVGFAQNPHSTASGKAFLAFCDDSEIESYFDDRQLEAPTENTITDWDELHREFEQIRAHGIAFDREESDTGIIGIGTVIIGSHGEPVGAYAAAMPIARFDETCESVSAALLKAGDDASRALRYRGEYPPKETEARNPKKPFVSR